MQIAYAIAINPSPLLILARHEIRIKTTLKTIGLCTALRAGGTLGAEDQLATFASGMLDGADLTDSIRAPDTKRLATRYKRPGVKECVRLAR